MPGIGVALRACTPIRPLPAIAEVGSVMNVQETKLRNLSDDAEQLLLDRG